MGEDTAQLLGQLGFVASLRIELPLQIEDQLVQETDFSLVDPALSRARPVVGCRLALPSQQQLQDGFVCGLSAGTRGAQYG
ncbi:hypothetical protein ACR6C2_00160 [Streptomyces sp. INA 01156]